MEMDFDPTVIQAQKEAKYPGKGKSQRQIEESVERVAGHGGEKYHRANGINANLEDGLQNDLDPRQYVTMEKPEHRAMAEMKAQGYTNREIAAHLGFSDHHVSSILRQPFARERILATIKKNTQEEMKKFLEAEVIPSLQVLKDVRDDQSARKSDRITAADKLLDRFLGKPVTMVDYDAKAPSEMSDEELRKQVESTLEQINRVN